MPFSPRPSRTSSQIGRLRCLPTSRFRAAPEWQAFVDGAWGSAGAGATAVLISPSGQRIRYATRLEFPCTNNITEYEGLVLALLRARALGVQRLQIKSDSQVVAFQVEKEYQAKEPELARYLQLVRGLEQKFQGFTVIHIPRAENEEADALAKAAAQGAALPPEVFYSHTTTPAVQASQSALAREVSAIHSTDWRTPIITFIQEQYVPEEGVEARRLQAKCRPYRMIGSDLFKTGVCAPWLRCVSKEEGRQVLQELHEGAYGAHQAARALVGKAFRQGMYWPTALNDAQDLVRRCDVCQRMSKMSRLPATSLHPIMPVWPLARWGIDLVGPLPTALGGYRFAVVAVEYFTKWVEAEPITTIKASNIAKFFWKNIICRFGVPKEVVVDNEKQFDSERFRSYAEELGVKVCFASVYHPQSNGACERANGTIFAALRKRIFREAKGVWAEELPNILWAYRTTTSRPMGHTPF